jgi:hypothetical protein
MATLISTSASNAGSTIADVLGNWVSEFGGSAHGTANTGGFNGGPLSGTQYSTSSKAGDSAFIAQSDTGLSYDIQKHVVTGDLDSLKLGETLAKAGNNFTLDTTKVSFTDLNWNTATTNAALTDLQTLNTSNPAPVLEQISDLLAGLESSFADAVSHYNNLYDNDPTYTFDTITLEQLVAVDAAELTPIASALFSESELAMAA